MHFYTPNWPNSNNVEIEKSKTKKQKNQTKKKKQQKSEIAIDETYSNKQYEVHQFATTAAFAFVSTLATLAPEVRSQNT